MGERLLCAYLLNPFYSYWGPKNGSINTILELGGDAESQALLLTYSLQFNKIPKRYVCIQFLEAQPKAWYLVFNNKLPSSFQKKCQFFRFGY